MFVLEQVYRAVTTSVDSSPARQRHIRTGEFKRLTPSNLISLPTRRAVLRWKTSVDSYLSVRRAFSPVTHRSAVDGLILCTFNGEKKSNNVQYKIKFEEF